MLSSKRTEGADSTGGCFPGVSARPGARYGPSGIRAGSARIAPEFAYDEMGFNAFQSWARIVDCGMFIVCDIPGGGGLLCCVDDQECVGDVPMLPFDNRIALAQLQKAYEVGVSPRVDV